MGISARDHGWKERGSHDWRTVIIEMKDFVRGE